MEMKTKSSNMKKSLCITTYVSGKNYQDFIPIFIFSLSKAYPEYDVIIFIGEVLNENVKKSLSLLEKKINFKIIENYLSFVPNSLTPRVSIMAKRWLLYTDDFVQYDYIYIGDIDVFILKENPSLLDQHIIHCKTIGLNYSNIIRKSHYNRITGLHFFNREPYFDKMLPVIDKYTQLMKNNELVYKYSCEYMLYDMISESGLGICSRAMSKDSKDPRKASFRVNHGFHLAIFRNFFIKKRDVMSEHIKRRITLIRDVIDDSLFFEIEQNIESKMVRRIIRRLKKFPI